MEQLNRFRIEYHNRTDHDFKVMYFTYCILVDEALRRGIRAEIVLNKYLQLEYMGKKQIFYYSDNGSMSGVAKKICCSKTDTKEFVSRAGLNVAEGRRFKRRDRDAIISYSKSLGSVVVIKPDEADYGRSVYCNVSLDDINSVIDQIPEKYDNLVVEVYVPGNEYRVFATINGYIAVCLRRPANVIGDGKSSVLGLIEKKNRFRHDKLSQKRRYPRRKLVIDDSMIDLLLKQNLSLDYVPKKGEQVFLRTNSNISSGGDCIDLTEQAHQSVKEIAIRVLESVPGLSYAGIDIITPDITKDIRPNYKVIEVNNMPGITIHHYPDVGRPQNVASALLDLVFPRSSSASSQNKF